MELRTTTDPSEILALVEPALAADPIRNTIFSSIVAALSGHDADGWCAWPHGHPTVLAARSQMHTPVAVTTGWDDIGALVDALIARPTLASLVGPVSTVDALAAALGTRGRSVTSRVAERLFRLDTLVDPAGVSGSARPATESDRARLLAWFLAFTDEAFAQRPAGFDPDRLVTRALTELGVWLWIDPAGEPSAMAVRHPVVHGAARIGPVFTPLPRRGNGYGSAATAAAARDILRQAATPVLFTDLANPTSNKIYQALGFRPVEDRLHVTF